MSSLIDPLKEGWMVDDTLLSDSNSILLVVYLVLRLETTRMSYMSSLLFNTGLIGLEVPNLIQSIIESGNEPYKGY